MIDILQEEELLEAAVISINIDEGEYTEEQAKEKFKITNLESASWAFRKLKAINANIAETKKLADIERKRIKEWEDKAVKDYERSISFFEYLLKDYFEKMRAEDPKFKLSTPYGKVMSRKQQDKWIYDEDVIVASLKKNGLDKFIRIKEEPNKTDLKKDIEILNNIVSRNGEIAANTVRHGSDLFINMETAEVLDTSDCLYHEKVAVIGGKVIEGIEVEAQPDSITIKVEV